MIRILLAFLAVASLGFFFKMGSPESVIGRYATSLQGRTPSQRHNTLLAAKKLNNAVIRPGETFSFNKRIGTCSRDAGYLRAPVSYNGALIDSWGGGVCQVSTTMYNAALLAGLEIVERNKHRFVPEYISPGRDAAVAYSTIDLRLRNSTEHPIKISASIVGSQLVVTISGHPLVQQPRVVTEIRGENEAKTYTIGHGGSSARLRNSGKNGYEVATYRIWPDRRELLSLDHYPVMHRIVEHR